MVNSETPSGQKTLASQIVAVTAYPDKALVTRQGVVFLTGQEAELVLAPLPDTIETQSIRVSGKGEIAVRLLEARCDRLFSTEPVAAKVTQLTQQIEQLQAQWEHLQAQIDALALQSRFIQSLGEKTQVQFSASLARKNITVSETLDFINFLGNQYTEYAVATNECKNRQKELDSQLQALHEQLQIIQIPRPKESYSLSVAIEPTGEGEFQLEVSYLVTGAGWTPLYDLRFDDTNNIANISYLAEITQNTGEDWLGVALSLSTAKPGLGTLPPKLQPWYIDLPRSHPAPELKRAAKIIKPTLSHTSENTSNTNVFPLLEIENPVEAETVVAKASHQGSTVTFQLACNGNIPSDGTPHKITIFQDDFPCNFNYVAIPRLVSFAYIQATIKNNADGITLLPGKANIFRDNIFVGTANLDNIVPGQEFQVYVGIEEKLKIERDLIERQVDKKLIGNNARILCAYRILITNLLSKQVNLKLIEQIPISRSEQIKVRLTRTHPQISVGEMGKLEWNMTIPAQAKQEVEYQFAVEYPSQLVVAGLDI